MHAPAISILNPTYQHKDDSCVEITHNESALVWLSNGSIMVVGNHKNFKTIVFFGLSQLLSHDESFKNTVLTWTKEHEEELLTQMIRRNHAKG